MTSPMDRWVSNIPRDVKFTASVEDIFECGLICAACTCTCVLCRVMKPWGSVQGAIDIMLGLSEFVSGNTLNLPFIHP